MTDQPDIEQAESVESPGDDRHDPFFTAFLIGIAALLLLCAVLILIADRRPPAGL